MELATMPLSIGQLSSKFSMLVCLLLPLIGSADNLQAQEKPVLAQPAAEKAGPQENAAEQSDQKQPAQITENLTPIQSMALNEMAWLRTQMGGGATESLKGFATGTDLEQQLYDSLSKLVREQGTMEEELPLELTTPPASLACEIGSEVGGGTTMVFGEIRGGGQSAIIDSGQQLVRTTARSLEELAAKLEQAKFYDKADELRKTAARYWLQARTMD